MEGSAGAARCVRRDLTRLRHVLPGDRTVPAIVLRVVERLVGVTDERLRVVAVAGVGGDAERERALERALVRREALRRHLAPDAFRELPRALAIGAVEHDGELLAAI